MNKLAIFIILTGALAFTSCNQEEPQRTNLEDLTEMELVDLVKINFLAQYGGIEQERKTVCEIFESHRDNCELKTILEMNIAGDNSEFDIQLRGEFKSYCFSSPFNQNSKKYSYYDEGSIGNSTYNNIVQEYDLQSSFTFTERREEDKYVYSGSTIRNLTFTSANYTNLDGGIHFRSHLCDYDLDYCEFKQDSEYTFSLWVSDKTAYNENLDFEGIIRKVDGIWTLESSEGFSTTIE